VLPATLDGCQHMGVRQSTLLEFNSLDASQTTAAVTHTALVLDTQHTVYSGCRLLDAEFSCIVLCRLRPIDGGNKKSCVKEQQSPEQPDQSIAHQSAKCDHVRCWRSCETEEQTAARRTTVRSRSQSRLYILCPMCVCSVCLRHAVQLLTVRPAVSSVLAARPRKACHGHWQASSKYVAP